MKKERQLYQLALYLFLLFILYHPLVNEVEIHFV